MPGSQLCRSDPRTMHCFNCFSDLLPLKTRSRARRLDTTVFPCFRSIHSLQAPHEPRLSTPLSINRKHGCSLVWLKPMQSSTLLQTRASKERHFEGPKAVFLTDPELPAYKAPQTGFISYLPQSWIPYAELMRLDKPAGTYYLFFPCVFSTLLAASYAASAPFSVLTTTFCFFSGALIMRGAGCTINDLWDRNLDPHVTRTRLRPIARGAVTPFRALVFTAFELLAGLGVLLQFPTSCLYYGIPSLILVATYPLAKRVTHYPQFVLGLTFSWGGIMGFPALGVNPLQETAALQASAALYASCVSWTVLYDMIYAHMDIKDDAKVGIKSIALRHEKETKTVLSGLAVVQIVLLAAAGAAVGVGPIFFVGSCGSAAATLGLMIWKVRLKDVSSCWWWFKNGALFTGGGIASGILAEYLLNPNSPIEGAEVDAISTISRGY